MKSFALRISVITMAVAISIAPAQAGFLDDFYTQSGATSTMTPAGVYQGQSANVVSGGAFSMRVPNRSFNPITFSPPNFSAGCGGIDMYLGAFGFPTGAEMTAFLRNVGQASGGIAFSIALKALSPELDATINDFSKRIQEMVGDFKNSCKAAQSLMDATGASAFIQEIATNARKNLRISSSDESEAEKKSADVLTAKTNAVQFSTNNPNSGLNPERNVVWEALNSGDYGSSLTSNEKRFIMGMTGTVKVVIDSYTDSSPPRVVAVPPVKTSVESMIADLVGSPSVSDVRVSMYGCSNKSTQGPTNYAMSNNCLITTGPSDEVIGLGFRYRLEEAKNAVTNAIRSRSALDASLMNHYATLNNASALPLLKVVQASAAKRNTIVGDQLVSQYLQVASTEMAIKYLRFAINEVYRGVGQVGNSNSAASIEAMNEITSRAKEITRQLDERDKSLMAQITGLATTLQLYESTQRYMQASLSTDLTRSMNIGR